MTTILLPYHNCTHLSRRCSSCNTDIEENIYTQHKIQCVYDEFMREKARKERMRQELMRRWLSFPVTTQPHYTTQSWAGSGFFIYCTFERERWSFEQTVEHGKTEAPYNLALKWLSTHRHHSRDQAYIFLLYFCALIYCGYLFSFLKQTNPQSRGITHIWDYVHTALSNI